MKIKEHQFIEAQKEYKKFNDVVIAHEKAGISVPTKTLEDRNNAELELISQTKKLYISSKTLNTGKSHE